MKTWITDIATIMLIVGYAIHAIGYFVVSMDKLGWAMIMFAIAMYFLFV